MKYKYNLFISHSWTYSNAYEQFIRLLDSDPHFSYRNYSVPKNDPIHNAPTDRLLAEAIRRQISACNVVIILAGVYSSYSKWIDKEIYIAKNFATVKPIIAVEPWGSERTSLKVKQNADRIVKWNTNSVIRAIKEIG